MYATFFECQYDIQKNILISLQLPYTFNHKEDMVVYVRLKWIGYTKLDR